ncbi:MAG: Hint domain-containing protein [Pseudomonadota bacterium]
MATPSGEKPVERLSIGELVCTSDHRAVPVKWVGRQTIAKVFAGERACLVRIEAGALGNHSDLYVTGDHGMVLDGYVVNASALVNGDNIDWVPYSETPERQTVYHVETTDHEIILANGAASETYVDVTGRQTFDNHQDYLDLYGAERTIAEMERPRISAQRLVPEAIKRKIGIVEKAIPGSTTDFSISHSSRATARTGA